MLRLSWTSLLVVLTVALAAGCDASTTPTDGGGIRIDAGGRGDAGRRSDAGSTSDAGGGGSDAGPGTDGGGAGTDAGPASDGGVLPSCVEFAVGTVGATVLTGTTSGGSDKFRSIECDGADAPDVQVLFTAPASASYVFHVVADDPDLLDAIISVHDADCVDPKERFCSDDTTIDDTDPTVAATLAAGEQIILNIDGLGAGDEGDFTLNITQSADTCPDMTLSSGVGTVVAGAELTVSTADNRTGSCTFGGGGRDLAYRWTTGGAGDYTFEVHTTMDTVLYLLDGDCAGDEIACNDDDPLVTGVDSVVTTNLSAGQTVIIVVEGFDASETGTFDLVISGPV